MNLEKYINDGHLKTQLNFAKVINATQAEVSDWINKKRDVPIKRCVQIEKLTNGAVTRKDLRPDDWHLIWPELKDKAE